MTPVRLIAADMDGTFLDDHSTFDHDRFQQVYTQLQERGIRFVAASGNQTIKMQRLFADFPNVDFIGQNGAEIQLHGEPLTAATFAPETVTKMLQIMTAYPAAQVAVCGIETVWIRQDADPQFAANMRGYYPHVTAVPDLAPYTQDIVKFDMIGDPQAMDKLAEPLRQSLAGLAVPTASGTGIIDLIQPGLDKAWALHQLSQRLTIAPAEMWAFGDGANDLSMFRYVGHSVAMANAAVAIQRAADAVAPANIASGVLAYIEQHVLAKTR